MDRREAMFGLLAAGPLMGDSIRNAAPDGADDEVRHLAEAYAAAWNASDMDAMADLYASDVHWVNIVGMHWQGKAQVDHAHRMYFATMFKGVPLTLEAIESVVALPGGALVAVIRWAIGGFRTPFGQRVPPGRDRMSLVLVPAADRLVIAHGSNVRIDEMAQRSDPTAAQAR